MRERADFRIGALGSGSDYTPFLQHLGIASLHIGYGGEDGGGSYHSIYDSFDHYTRFGDPGFAYGVTQAQTAGRLVLRLAGADFLPFDFDSFTGTVTQYVEEVVKLADDLREETEEGNRRIRERTYDLAADPLETWITPPARETVPFLNFSPLHNALALLRRRSAEFTDARKGADSSAGIMKRESRRALDRLFMGFERSLTTKPGLPGRPWYQHAIYAPGKYTGYGVKTLPGIREAIEQRSWKEAQDQIEVAARVLEQAAGMIGQATKVLR
jgi:N-acetylated-alpha-linked acidic dipeptidase